jgi:hypothetical protein
MVRKLTAHVHLDGVWYRPGDSPPPEVAKLITNPDVWDGPAEPSSAAADTTPPVRAESGSGSPSSTLGSTTESPRAEPVQQPPRSGPGSGGPAWIEFAASKGVTEKFDSKGALISHLENEGLIEKE